MRAWEEFLTLQESELGVETVHKWLKTLKISHFDARNLFLEAKDSFHAMWFEEHIRDKVLHKFVNNNNKKINVHLSVANATPQKNKTLKKSAKPLPPTFNLTFDELDPYNTFERFVVSENNFVTHKFLSQLCQSSLEPGTFNPIYIHGTAGTGKTHLLMAIAHALKNRGVKVLYSRAETFTEHVVASIRLGEMSVFREAYRKSEVLIIDGVQVLSKKGATQEEFFHTFNTLHLAGKQIILSANCSPAELQYIEPRLVSRFEWGITMNLFPVNKDELRQIVHQKSVFLNFPIHQKVIDFLIENFTRSQSVIKALEALILRSHLNKQCHSLQLTVPQVKQVLNDLIIEEKKHKLTPEKILLFVAEIFGLKTEDLLGKGQTREHVFPRQLAMYFCRNKLKMPFTKIGELFSKDHSTVMSSVKMIQAGLDTNNSEITSAHHSLQKKLDSIS